MKLDKIKSASGENIFFLILAIALLIVSFVAIESIIFLAIYIAHGFVFGTYDHSLWDVTTRGDVIRSFVLAQIGIVILGVCLAALID
jgi:hypothetical protein